MDDQKFVDFAKEVIELGASKYQFHWLEVVFACGMICRALVNGAPMSISDADSQAKAAFGAGMDLNAIVINKNKMQ